MAIKECFTPHFPKYRMTALMCACMHVLAGVCLCVYVSISWLKKKNQISI